MWLHDLLPNFVCLRHSREFPLYFWQFILIFFVHAYLVHECCVEVFGHGVKVVLIVGVREIWVLGLRTEYRKIPPFPESVAPVLLLIVELWVWPDECIILYVHNRFALYCTFTKYEEDWGNIIRVRTAYVLYLYYSNRCMMKCDLLFVLSTCCHRQPIIQ